MYCYMLLKFRNELYLTMKQTDEGTLGFEIKAVPPIMPEDNLEPRQSSVCIPQSL